MSGDERRELLVGLGAAHVVKSRVGKVASRLALANCHIVCSPLSTVTGMGLHSFKFLFSWNPDSTWCPMELVPTHTSVDYSTMDRSYKSPPCGEE